MDIERIVHEVIRIRDKHLQPGQAIGRPMKPTDIQVMVNAAQALADHMLKSGSVNGPRVYWYCHARYWSGVYTGRRSPDGYSEVALDPDCQKWGPQRDDRSVGWVLSSLLTHRIFVVTPAVGYYDDARQTEPAQDPGTDVECPLCGSKLSLDNVRTVSVMPDTDQEGQSVPRIHSYFYRLHRTCHEQSTEAQRLAMDEFAMNWLPPGSAN